ncbi:MAG: transglycosylase domain-containing protein [Prevotella sp.]
MKKVINIVVGITHNITNFISWYKKLYKGRAWYTKTAVAFVSFIVAIFIYLGMVDINFLWLFGKSPGFKAIATPPTYAASEIYSADSVLIGRYYKENRTPVKYGEVNPMFWRALIDTEDERFYSHHGIDPVGILGAVKDAITNNDARGASTITQQLAKNLFRVRTQYSTGLLGKVPGIKMLIMKSKEWIIATKLEMIYDKNDILTMYANTVDFGNNSFGIKTAARAYYNTTPKDLTTDQIAVLVGMLKATTSYSPILNPEKSKMRRNVVLSNMMTHGDLSKDEYKSLSELPIKLNRHIEDSYEGQAQYFREEIAKYLKDWLDDNGYDLYSSGLKIYTTIDTRMQKYAEMAAEKQMRQIQARFNSHWRNMEPWRDENGELVPNFIENIAKELPVYASLKEKFPNQPDSVDFYMNKPHKVKLFDYAKGHIEKEMSTMDSIRYMVKFMHCSMVAMEPQTGAVRAWVGDIDFDTWKYDKVMAMRQPGSTFKLFVYTEAINQGLLPCDKRRDQYISMQVQDKKTGEINTWTPTNANGRFSGDSITLMQAFAQSINSIAVRLGSEMGIKNIAKTAHDMGIKSPLEEEPSLSLGSSDVNLLEMVNAYCTVANNGKQHDPVLVTKILDYKGNEVYIAPNDDHKVLPYRTAFLMQEMLKGGRTMPGGTSMSLNAYITPDTDWGGKTGTSNNHSDAWFIGVSPKLVVGAWVGGEYRCIHFRTGALGQGSRTALPLCGYFIQSVFRDPAYQKYHAKWEKADDEEIEPYMYQCSYTPTRPQEPDTLTIHRGDEEADEGKGTEGENDNGENTEASTSPVATEPSKQSDATINVPAE